MTPTDPNPGPIAPDSGDDGGRAARILRIGALLALGAVLVTSGLAVAARSAADGPSAVFFRAPTAHEAHRISLGERNLVETEMGSQWLREADAALERSLEVRSPYREAGRFVRPEADATGYRVTVERGQRLEVAVSGTIFDEGDLFVDLFRVGPEGTRPARVRSLRAPIAGLSVEPGEDAEYILRLQSALFAEGSYELSIRVVPTLLFPVAGRNNSHVWSAFGVEREGGRRQHNGIDIFADRGTPVLAASDAYVRRVDETPVGGKVVWLRDRERGFSIYYAHLDSQVVRDGQDVTVGDTLGFVGNTGNARTTPPHLHFGIYQRGPRDPFPFVRLVDTEVPEVEADLALTGSVARPATPGIRIRARPSLNGSILDELEDDRPFRVVAATGEWYRIRLPDGAEGYVSERVTRDAGLGRVALRPSEGVGRTPSTVGSPLSE